MSDFEPIHHPSLPGRHTDAPEVFAASTDWDRITCDACRMERPLEPIGPEYFVPADVLARDARVIPSLAEIRSDRVAAVDVIAEGAQTALSGPLTDEQARGIEREGFEASGAQNRSEAVLSPEAQRDLIDAEGWQGAIVRTSVFGAAELRDAGLIGIGGGLTRRGTIVRQRLMRMREDEVFG